MSKTTIDLLETWMDDLIRDHKARIRALFLEHGEGDPWASNLSVVRIRAALRALLEQIQEECYLCGKKVWDHGIAWGTPHEARWVRVGGCKWPVESPRFGPDSYEPICKRCAETEASDESAHAG